MNKTGKLNRQTIGLCAFVESEVGVVNMDRSAVSDARFPFSFIKPGSGDGKPDLWSPEETGDWSQDNAIGRGYASELVNYMRDRQDPTMLGRVVRSMILRRTYGGVEVGFLQGVAEASF